MLVIILLLSEILASPYFKVQRPACLLAIQIMLLIVITFKINKERKSLNSSGNIYLFFLTASVGEMQFCNINLFKDSI